MQTKWDVPVTRRSERGFVGVAAALTIVGLLAFSGLAIDVGYMQWERRKLQNAADAAAMGAVRELQQGNLTNLASAGRNDAALNGFTNGVNNTVVTINNPPTYGIFAGDSSAVEAVVQQTVPTYFMMILGRNSVTISARAVAQKATTTGTIGGCIFALSGTASRAFQVAGSPNVSTACSAVVNSTDSTQAFEMEGSETIFLQNGAKIGVVGNWALNGQTLWDVASNSATSPVHTTAVTDPLAAVTAPTSGTVVSTKPVSYDMNNAPAGNKLQPGVYCGGLQVQNTNGATYVMQAGTYIMAGGGFTLNSLAKVDASSGVTVYTTSSTGWGCASSYAFGPVLIDGQAVVNWKAPTSGTLTGIAFFQDRAQGTSSVQNKIVGGSSTSIDGALYFRNSKLLFSGANSSSGYMVLVADTIVINGNSTFGNNYTTLASNNPFAPASTGGGLVE